MIVVQTPTSPKVTDLSNQFSRVRMRGNSDGKKLRELLAKKSSGQFNTADSEQRIAMVLAGEEFPVDADVDTEITRLRLSLEVCNEAEQSLKAPLAKAKYEAATAVLKGIKPEHDKLVNRLVTALVEDFAPAYIELFQLSRDLKDKDFGWRDGVCDLIPQLVDIFGPPNAHSALSSLLQAAVKLGYLNVKDLPKEIRG